MDASSLDERYDELLDRYRRATYVDDAAGALRWDQLVMMPEGGTPARSRQLSTLSTLEHDLLVDDAVADLLADLDGVDLDDERAAVVREIRREHERDAAIPSDLVEALARERSEANEVWEAARAADDWDAFAPTLETVIDLQVERAEHIDPAQDPYETMFEDGEPYLGLETVERVFDRLREELVPFIDELRASDATMPSPFEGEFPVEDQEAVSREALDLLGYDWERGRMDTSAHPFSSGTQFDARVTTRFDESDPVGSITATIHEFGHATYTQGLREDAYGTPLGEPRSSGVHESQSRFWENHVGRTRAFWELFLPKMKARFPQLEDVTVDEAYRAVNRIYPDNLIRVEADELTYHLHIILRAEIEQAVLDGEIALEDVPQAWNDRMESYLGVRPATDANGCLQDVHWSSRFASFQNYTVGSVLAAQLHAAMVDDLGDLDGIIRDGEFEPIHEWLTEHVHRHGCRYTTDELVEVATGEPLTADYFLDYAREKFGDLYGV